MKHTPGPWTFRFVNRGSRFVYRDDLQVTWDTDPYYVVDFGPEGAMLGCLIEDNDSEAEANARLIAAAPMLLNALKILLNRIRWDDSLQRFLIDDGSVRDFLTMESIRQARYVVTKADPEATFP